jgi:hypothetical protein
MVFGDSAGRGVSTKTEKLYGGRNNSVSEKTKSEESSEKAVVTLPATVEKIIPPAWPGQPEKAQITVHGAEDLYKEIRVDNELQGPDGAAVALKKGAHVEVTIEAEPHATEKKGAAGSTS